MNVAVRYYTRGGNTKKLAAAIAGAVGAEARDCSEPLTEPVDLLFLGGSVYWGGVDKNIRQFIGRLDPAKVKRVAVFGTSALKKEPDRELEKLVRDRGIPVSEHGFHCSGEFSAMHKGHPDAADLSRAAVFARTAMTDAK